MTGAKVQEVVGKLYATTPAIVDRARKLAIRPDSLSNASARPSAQYSSTSS